VAIAAAASPYGLVLRDDSHEETTTSSGCAFTRYRPLTDNPVLRRLLESEQFVSLAFGQKARDAGIAVSMGSKGCAYDNAVAESFFATLKKELVHRRSWPTRRELISEVFEFVEGFYNTTRRHSTLGYLSPAQFEIITTIKINKENR
jgi:transposase InsO family protein